MHWLAITRMLGLLLMLFSATLLPRYWLPCCTRTVSWRYFSKVWSRC